MEYEYIESLEALQDYCKSLATARTIAFDTEFDSEKSYWPTLCLIQVATESSLAIIDPIAIGDVSLFWETLAAGNHETIVHAGRSDTVFCRIATGRWPVNIYDVQIAAAFAGREYPSGLSSLIFSHLGETLSSKETRSYSHRLDSLDSRQAGFSENRI